MSPQHRHCLENALQRRLIDRKTKSRLRQLTTFPATAVDFSSNSYLSLSTIPEVRQSFLRYLQDYASTSDRLPLLGSGGSRLLDGNNALAETLEQEIAAFHNAATGLLFNSGFDANVGLFSCVPQPGDIVIYDELVHASVHDGMKMSRAEQKIAFRHNSVSSLKETLGAVVAADGGTAVQQGLRNVIVVVEGVYSMDGHVAPLKDIVEALDRHLPRGNGRLVVDEAHSTGIFGEHGRGIVCELGLEHAVFARLHTFGKALGGSGAIVLCSPIVREYLVNYARPLIYTTSMAPACLASIKVAYAALQSPRVETMRMHLRNLTLHAHSLLVKACATARRQQQQRLVSIDSKIPQSPIIPLFSPRPRELAQYCQERGLIVRPIVAPTVPKGRERLRICLHAANTEEQVEALVLAIEAWTLTTAEEDLELVGEQGVVEEEGRAKPRL